VSGKPTGFIVGESAQLKKGDKSVAVAKQYVGVVGKVENCQVGYSTPITAIMAISICDISTTTPKISLTPRYQAWGFLSSKVKYCTEFSNSSDLS